MKKYTATGLCILSILFLINWSSESSHEGEKKQEVNIHGMLITRSGEKLKVSNLAIGGSYKHITLYIPEEFTANNPDKVLMSEPEKGNREQIDLHEGIAKISTPDPKNIWIYSVSESKKHKYIAIEVEFKNGTKRSYLINTNNEITCNHDGVQKFVPFKDLDTLTLITPASEKTLPE